MSAKTNRSEVVYEGRVFNIYAENVTLPNGSTTDLNLLRHPGAAAMVAMPSPGQVILLKQYRHAVMDYIWEIPAGTRDPGETPETCARRELAEEAGVSAGSWQKLGEIIPAPGYTDERIHIFLARDLTPTDQNLDTDEVLDVHQVDFEKAMSMVRDGLIIDAKTITGLFLARDFFLN